MQHSELALISYENSTFVINKFSKKNILLNIFKSIIYRLNIILLKNLDIYLNNFKTNYSIYLNTLNDLSFIENNQDIPYDWYLVSNKINITQEFIEKFINKDWDWNIISYKTYKPINISLDFINKYINKSWNWKFLSANKNLNIEFIEKNIDKDWDWKFLSRNIKNKSENGCNLLIPFEFIEKHIDKDWDWKLISKRESIPFEFIEKHIDKDWNWKQISKRESIPQEFIEKYSHKDWDWRKISEYNWLTEEFILKFIDKSWNWAYLLYQSEINNKFKICSDFIQKYIDQYDNEINWIYLSRTKDIPITFIKKYNEKHWDYRYLISKEKDNILRSSLIFNLIMINLNDYILESNMSISGNSKPTITIKI